MKIFSYFITIFLLLISCTVLKVSERLKTGYFKSNTTAKMIDATDLNLDTIKSLLVVPNGEYMKGMSENIGFFENIMTFEELEEEIIRTNMQDEVGSLAGKIGLNNVYRKYKKYLYLHFEANPDNKNKLQLKLTNPGSLEDIFVAETNYDPVVAGVYDANTFNPLFNELIKYIEMTAKSYRRN